MIVANIQLPYGNHNIKSTKSAKTDEDFASTISQLLTDIVEESDITESDEISFEDFVNPVVLMNIPFIQVENPDVNLIMGESNGKESDSQLSLTISQPIILDELLNQENETGIKEILPQENIIPQQVESIFMDSISKEVPVKKADTSVDFEKLEQDSGVENQEIYTSSKHSSKTMEKKDSYLSEKKAMEAIGEKAPISKEDDLILEDKSPFTEFVIGDREFAHVTQTVGEEVVVAKDNIQNISNSIIKLVETTTEGKTSVMTVQLYPEDLGKVDIILRMDEGKIVAKIMVESDHIKHMFNNKINELNENMIKQNVQVEKMEIELNTTQNYLNSQSDFSKSPNRESRNNFMKNQMANFERDSMKEKSLEEVSSSSGAISILA